MEINIFAVRTRPSFYFRRPSHSNLKNTIPSVDKPLHKKPIISCLSIFFLLMCFLTPAQAVEVSDIRSSVAALRSDTQALVDPPLQISLTELCDIALNSLDDAIIQLAQGKSKDETQSYIETADERIKEYREQSSSVRKLQQQSLIISAAIKSYFSGEAIVVDAVLPPGSAADGAQSFAVKLCRVCHADDGSGGVVNIAIQNKDGISILTTVTLEEVHSGISMTDQEASDIAEFLANPGPLPTLAASTFADPNNCRICHPRQYNEWQGSMMSYGAQSPLFGTLEFVGNELTGGALANNNKSDGSDLFCQSCHNPIDVMAGTLPTFEESGGQPLFKFASDTGKRGISCDYCHQVSGPDLTRTLNGDLGDGIANVALTITPGDTKYGPTVDPIPNPIHTTTNSSFLRSSEFCGGCHDVRPRAADVVTGEPFQRLENLFTEWQNGPYGPTAANTVGKVVSCQDCHMNEGAPSAPGVYPYDKTTVYPRPRDVVERRVSTHYFTGVDIAMIPFPGQDVAGVDSHGLPIGQEQRRRELLKSAATMVVTTPSNVTAGTVLPVVVNVTNVGAGHNIPSGFSQERQMWIELSVKDGKGATVYQSGFTTDKAHRETKEMNADGNLEDEDLENLIVVLDPATGEATTLEHGPDYNQRHDHPPVNLGLANFGNEFIRVDPVTGHEEEVFIPFLANHMNNSFSIPSLETASVPYDIPIPAGTKGPITVKARLLFRAFPPRFMRILSQIKPDIVTEAMVDKNRILEMVNAPLKSINVTAP